MKSRQYTIRSIPSKIDQVLRERARKSGKSLNEVVLEVLASGTGVANEATFDDLDWFIGNNSLGKSFDAAQEWLDSAPQEIQ